MVVAVACKLIISDILPKAWVWLIEKILYSKVCPLSPHNNVNVPDIVSVVFDVIPCPPPADLIQCGLLLTIHYWSHAIVV